MEHRAWPRTAWYTGDGPESNSVQNEKIRCPRLFYLLSDWSVLRPALAGLAGSLPAGRQEGAQYAMCRCPHYFVSSSRHFKRPTEKASMN